MNNITIVGLGAIGSVYATTMFDNGVAVRVALDADRRERYTKQGVVFNGKRYDFDYYTPSSGDTVADLVIIATKSSGLADALELIAPIVGENTQILPLLNGITSEEVCAARFGWQRVIYGYFIGHTSTRYGNEIKQDGQFRTFFGERLNHEITPRIAAVKELFDRAHIPYKVPENIVDSLWQKFIVNIGMNQATAVLHCTYGHLQSSEVAHRLMVDLMQEAAAVGAAHGIENTDKMVEKAVSLLTTLSAEDGSSMYQDVMSNRPTEVDIFADTVCEMGMRYDVETPLNYYVGKILKALV